MTLTPHPFVVQWSRKGRSIPLLPLWAVRPVQSLSACTRVTFTFTSTPGRNHPQPPSITVGRISQLVYRLATGWTVRGSSPRGGEIFRTCPDRPWGPTSLLYNGYRAFPVYKGSTSHAVATNTVIAGRLQNWCDSRRYNHFLPYHVLSTCPRTNHSIRYIRFQTC